MGSLEEARRTIEALAQEKDYYKDFWQATNNYHSVMSRFQVPAPSLTTAPFTSHFPYSSASAPVSQVNTPQFSVSSYPLYSGATGLVASEMHHLQCQEEGPASTIHHHNSYRPRCRASNPKFIAVDSRDCCQSRSVARDTFQTRSDEIYRILFHVRKAGRLSSRKYRSRPHL